MHFVGYFTIFNVIYILCLLLLLRCSFRSSTLGRLLSLSRLRTERVSGALILDLLDLLLRWWVSLEGNVLPLLGGVVSSLDGRSKSNESLGDGRLENLRGELQFVSIHVALQVWRADTYHVVAVVFLHLLDAVVDDRLLVSALDDEFLLALEMGGREENVFDKGKDTVALYNLGERLCLADFAGDDFWRVEEIDFAVCYSSA